MLREREMATKIAARIESTVWGFFEEHTPVLDMTSNVENYVERLSADPGWSAEEVTEIQHRILTVLTFMQS
jgi:hypothetical protein